MAAASILPVDVIVADSADVVVASSLTVGLKGAVKDCVVIIKLKDDAGGYNPIGELNFSKQSYVIQGAGTYRFSRVAGPACGVYSG